MSTILFCVILSRKASASLRAACRRRILWLAGIRILRRYAPQGDMVCIKILRFAQDDKGVFMKE